MDKKRAAKIAYIVGIASNFIVHHGINEPLEVIKQDPEGIVRAAEAANAIAGDIFHIGEVTSEEVLEVIELIQSE